MKTNLWNDSELVAMFQAKTPLIDVRSPSEFIRGFSPYSVNLPIMTDHERHLVGIQYKELGQESAIKLGYQLVSGEIKEKRVGAWLNFLHDYPNAQVICFRGGLRSQISCHWISESGILRSPLHGGYKRLRGFFLSWLNEAPLPRVVRLGGFTGSGKTKLLETLNQSIDLEGLANHRGSAFGNCGVQPSQASFENHLAVAIIQSSQTVIIEDESAMIGSIRLPNRFYHHIRSSPLVVLEMPLNQRAENIFNLYVMNRPLDFFLMAIEKLHKKLGGVRARELRDMMILAFSQGMTFELHRDWIINLLTYYYDPIYQRDINRQTARILFRGETEAVRKYLVSV